MKTKNDFICDNAGLYLPHVQWNMDKAISYAERLHEVLAERGYTSKRVNTKKDYWTSLTVEEKDIFNRFWDAYDYKAKCSKKNAIKSFCEIHNPTDEMYELVIYGASMEAKYRPDAIAKGRTPIHAQGWLSGSRWEGYEMPKKTPVNNVEMREALQDLQHIKSMPDSDYRTSEIERIETKIKGMGQ